MRKSKEREREKVRKREIKRERERQRGRERERERERKRERERLASNRNSEICVCEHPPAESASHLRACSLGFRAWGRFGFGIPGSFVSRV